MAKQARRDIRLTIIGLGCIGTSLGLACKAAGLPVHIVGHDKEPRHTQQALRRKAIDKGAWNLPRSVSKADLVVLSIPFSEIKDTLRYIAEDLRPNAVVMDTSPLMEPVLTWARELLPAHVHFVSGHPVVRDVLSGPEHARADLFQGEFFALCPAVESEAAAVQLVVDMITAIGARPLFLDPAEHDSMMAAVEQLPRLLALVLGSAVIGQPSWQDMQRLAGGQFEAATYTASSSAEGMVAEFLANREHLFYWLGVVQEAIARWRQELADEKAASGLTETVETVLDARAAWVHRALTRQWEAPERAAPRYSFVDWLFGQGLARRWRQERGERT